MSSRFAKRAARGANPPAAGGAAAAPLKKLVVFILVFILTPSPPARAQDFTPVSILIPRFESPRGSSTDVGWKAASILGLQIWRTYSRRTEKQSDFDNADFVFVGDARPKSYAEAESFARERKKSAHLVLWGSSSRYGDGIVVEANLMVRKGAGKSDPGTNIWSVTIPTGKSSRTIAVDIPAWQYEFAPMILEPGLLKKFEEESRSLRRLDSRYWLRSDHMLVGIYSMKSTGSELKGSLDSGQVQAILHEGEWSYVQMAGEGHGWIYLPKLSQSPSEVVNFCSGIIRILRKDYAGAGELFQGVVKNNNSPTAVKIDSLLYMAIAHDKLRNHEKSFAMIAEAYRLNPYSRVTTQYLCMSYLASLSRLLSRDAGGADAQKIIRSIQEVVSKNKVLFAEDDPWVKQVEQVLAELAG